MIFPYPGITADHEARYNRGREIASEYGVPFLDLNLTWDDYQLDFSTDMADADHVNYSGNVKFSGYIGDYISREYALPDRRGDKRYVSWKKNAAMIQADVEGQALIHKTAAGEVTDTILGAGYTVFARFADLDQAKALLSEKNRILAEEASLNEKEGEEAVGQWDVWGGSGIYLLKDGMIKGYFPEDSEWEVELYGCLARGENTGTQIVITYDGQEYCLPERTSSFIVFSDGLEGIVGCAAVTGEAAIWY